MTDREKVIKGLEIARKLAWNGEHCNIMDADDALTVSYAITDALALLKAQEPVEPVVDKNTSTGECEDPWGRLFFCGACGKRINEKYDPDEDDKYCKHCGRAVKWE